MQRPDLGGGILRRRQVIEIEGVLGMDRAADVAIAAMDAGALFAALRVDPARRPALGVRVVALVGPVLGEGDGERQLAEPLAMTSRRGRLAHQPEAAGQLAVGQLLHANHPAGLMVVGLQCGVGNLRRPALVEDMGRRLDADVGVDQRAAADAGPLNDRHALENLEVDPTVLALGRLVAPDPGITRLARVISLGPAATALQHQHPTALLGEAAGHDRATEAAADDDDVVHRPTIY